MQYLDEIVIELLVGLGVTLMVAALGLGALFQS
jgi:hypothetical protein